MLKLLRIVMAGEMVQLASMRTCVPSTEPMENDHEEEARSGDPRAWEEEEGSWANWPVSLAPLVERKFNSGQQCLREDSQKLSSGLNTQACLPMNT